MIQPAARTRDEAELYLDLNPCPTCGSAETAWQDSYGTVDDRKVQRFHGSCGNCGTPREIVLLAPTALAHRAPDDRVRYGGGRPSELIDAGQWLAVADLAARSSGIDVQDIGTPVDPEAVALLTVAAEAMTEILKFIPPDDDEVPDSAFWTDGGSALHRASPGRFRRRRLALVRDSYQDLLDRLALG